MESPPAVIQYASPPTSTARLQLFDEPGLVRIVFRAPSVGIFVVNVVAMLVIFGSPILKVAAIFYMFRTFKMPGFSIADMVGRSNIVLETLYGVVGLLLIIHEIWKYRRWGCVSRVLTVDTSQISLTWLGFHRMRSRRWPAESITDCELKVVTDVFTRKPHHTLILRRGKRLPLRFGLPTKELELPGKILAAVRKVLSKENVTVHP